MSEDRAQITNKDGNTKEWWLTNFTMEQVEGRLKNQQDEIDRLRAEIKELKWEADFTESRQITDLSILADKLQKENEALRARVKELGHTIDRMRGRIAFLESVAPRVTGTTKNDKVEPEGLR